MRFSLRTCTLFFVIKCLAELGACSGICLALKLLNKLIIEFKNIFYDFNGLIDSVLKLYGMIS